MEKYDGSKKEILMQPNNLIKGKYACTAVENKLFYKILFNAQKRSKDNSYMTFLTRDDFADVLKNKNELTEKNISNILTALHQTILEFDYIDENTKDLITYRSGLIGESKYNHTNDTFEISLHEILYKHITNFIQMQQTNNGYTPLNLELLFRFKSIYTQRLYTLLRAWSREGTSIETKYRVEELRKYLKLSDDIYPEYKSFKGKLLNRSIREINEIGNMNVKIVSEIRVNRKVDTIVFSVDDHEPRKYFDSKEIKDKKEKINDVELVEIYVPNKKLFTDKTLSNFIRDFKDVDFKLTNNKDHFYKAIGISLEKDNEDKIKVKNYNYFKTVLINNLKNNKEKDFKKTKFHNFDETYTQYTPDELDNIIEKSQQEKFGK